jgi:polysaccharide export outer membrane protein
MKTSTLRPKLLGFLLIAVAAPVLGQAPASKAAVPSVSDSAPTPSVTPGNATSEIKPNDEHFLIGNSDFLAVNVWREPEISRSFPVRSDGKISLPLIGEVQAAGRTPLQLEIEIAEKLRNYITDPQVTVIVQQINSEKFNILGQVGKPGTYPLIARTTVLDAIAGAGGFRDFAKRKGIYILRKDEQGNQSRLPFNYKNVIEGKHFEQNVEIRPNDTIVVP